MRSLTSRALAMSGQSYAKETYYHQLLVHAAKADKIVLPALYPVGSAANATLLYLLYRCVTELPVSEVLEIGAGQSSFLLDAIGRVRNNLRVTTLETSKDWAQRVAQRVSHRVVTSALRDGEYESLSSVADRRYDLVLVDGPVGTRRSSRRCCLNVLRRCLGPEYVVIFDDAQRQGEMDTVAAFAEEAP